MSCLPWTYLDCSFLTSWCSPQYITSLLQLLLQQILQQNLPAFEGAAGLTPSSCGHTYSNDIHINIRISIKKCLPV